MNNETSYYVINSNRIVLVNRVNWFENSVKRGFFHAIFSNYFTANHVMAHMHGHMVLSFKSVPNMHAFSAVKGVGV